MVVQHNMSAANANRMLGVVGSQQSKSTEKLASGYRINRAGDDAAGLAISEKMRGQIRGLNQATANAQDGISLIQTAEGALTETHSILQRMRELAIQASSDTNTDDDRKQIQGEIDQLTSEVNRIANTTEFNTKKLLDGSKVGAKEDKDGVVKYEGNFENSNVTIAFSSDNSGRVTSTDVIRIEVKKSISAGTAVADRVDTNHLDVSHLFSSNVVVSGGTADGSINVVISGTDTDGATEKTTVIEITNANSLKAGDVIMVSVQARQNEKEAETGKEALKLQIGANASQEISLSMDSMTAKDLNIVTSEGKALDVTSQKKASLTIYAYDNAIQKVSSARSKMGAVQNRLEHTIANLSASSENLQTAESRIRDTDMAAEMVNFSQKNILQQAAQSMLAQANQSTQGVLSLLR